MAVNHKVRSSSLLSGAMPTISTPKISVKSQIFQIVKDALKNTPHDISTHAGFSNFKAEMDKKILNNFPSDQRDGLSKIIDDAIMSHGEFHDINREKSEGEFKKKK